MNIRKLIREEVIKMLENDAYLNVVFNGNSKQVDWAKRLIQNAEKIQMLTSGKFEYSNGVFPGQDAKHGPVCIVKINGEYDKLWSLTYDGILLLDVKEWGGSLKDIADAINGDKDALKRLQKGFPKGAE